jgi:transposase
MFVGMDVHRNRTQVCVLDEEGGGEVYNRNLANRPELFSELLGGLAADTPVVFEAAYGAGWVAELLEELHLEPHLAHPSGCRAIAAAKLKYDKLDARTLANLLRTGYLAEAWLAPAEVRDQRLLLRQRAWLVRARTMAKNRVRAQLADLGIAAPAGLWFAPGRAWLEDLDLPVMHRRVVSDCESLLAILEARIDGLDAQIRRDACADGRVAALCALPGVGVITAMTLVAEVGDISRFPTARKLCAGAGLTPSMRNSDRKAHHGHITKTGPPAVRHVLGEAAQVARRYEPYRSDFARIQHRRGTGIALVRTSRKLLTEAFHILRALQA